MGVNTLPAPIINGNRFAYSSIAVRLLGQRYFDIKEIGYSDALEPGVIRGTTAQIIGRTRGEYTAEGHITFYREGYSTFLAALQALTTTSGLSATGSPAGYMEVSFDVVVQYAEAPVSPVQTEVLKGCRVKKIDQSYSESLDALTVKCDLHVMAIARGINGVLGYPLNLLQL